MTYTPHVCNQIQALCPDPCPLLLFSWLMEPAHQVLQCFPSPTGEAQTPGSEAGELWEADPLTCPVPGPVFAFQTHLCPLIPVCLSSA